MKSSISVVDGGRGLAPELVAAREVALRTARANLAMFGVSELSSRPAMVGIRTVNDIEARFQDGLELPPALAAARKTVLRSVGDFLLLFGVAGIKLEYSADDIDIVKKQWQVKPEAAGHDDPDMTADEIATVKPTTPTNEKP